MQRLNKTDPLMDFWSRGCWEADVLNIFFDDVDCRYAK